MLDWLVEPHRSPPVRDPLLMQLFFASDLSDEDVLEILVAARTTHQQRLDSLRDRKGEESSLIPPSPERERDAALSGMTLDGSIATARANVDWLDDCIERVEGGLPGRPRRDVRQHSNR
jgi:PadR family transcriptional regulator AphA